MISFLTLKVPSTTAELIVLGDLHFGSPEQNPKKIRKAINYALNKENVYVLSIGDNLDLSTAKSFGVIGVTPSPQQSVKDLAHEFRPLAEAGKLIGFLQGNHDYRLTKQTGTDLDLTEGLVHEWNEVYGGKILYGKPVILLTVKVRRGNEKDQAKGEMDTFACCFTHGTGGGRVPGGVANWMQRMTNLVADADIYGQGHHHQPMTMRRYQNLCNPEGIGKKEQLFFTTGGHIEDAEYAQTKMLQSCPSLDGHITMTGRTNHRPTGKKKIKFSWFDGDID